MSFSLSRQGTTHALKESNTLEARVWTNNREGASYLSSYSALLFVYLFVFSYGKYLPHRTLRCFYVLHWRDSRNLTALQA
ncbi:hypothetical protein BO79DRAFT_38351 [Aspergillus costaricaensis CBS 115574]|uniref:Uncharacterized protein n=1 Tax=Aspergillus costaricaensis CBS 115574 TaxID=1448317 RepID=A0ACD1I679_9EURO|nr:hypothetical protein BO79DRAFT_38351 [Aspergillus costaricaensis CBS 115574]RAK86077.1 hypothetical protein BO79DRAFT_38351 [Aspergillus costaricaensis CBS 115574]